VVDIAANDKTYDGSANATVNLSDKRVSGDVFEIHYDTALFDDQHVGAGKTVTVSGISLLGIDASNYTVNNLATDLADISARSLTVAIVANDKTYDGTAKATVTLSDDRVVGDILNVSYDTALFPNKHVGADKSVTVSGIAISGTDAGNYIVNSSATDLADITARPLTVSIAALAWSTVKIQTR
jgi:hypothetical protein